MTSCTLDIIINQEIPQGTWDNLVWWRRLTFWIRWTTKLIFSVIGTLKVNMSLSNTFHTDMVNSAYLSLLFILYPIHIAPGLGFKRLHISRLHCSDWKNRTATGLKWGKSVDCRYIWGRKGFQIVRCKTSKISQVKKFYNHCWLQNIIVKMTAFTANCYRSRRQFECWKILHYWWCKWSWVVCNELDFANKLLSNASRDTSAHDNTNQVCPQ